MKLATLSHRALQVLNSGGQQLSLALAISDGEAISTYPWCSTRLIVYCVRKNEGASARTLYLQRWLDSSCIVLCGFLLRWCNHSMVDARTHRIADIHTYCGARAKGFALVFSPWLDLS